MVAWRYEISLLVFKKYFTRSLSSLVKYFSTLEEKFRISARPCNILYIYNNFLVIFAGIALKLEKVSQLFQVSIYVHPCHPFLQVTGNSFSA